MATPKAAQNVSTPKNTLTSTPSRHNASPRPHSSALANKAFAYKSPAVKTPASLHGHSYRISASSHQNSTPLTAPAIHDDLLNLNSPATALIASMGNAGLTPLASGQDGLGITAGIAPQPGRDTALQSRNPETQRLNRLEQVAKLLKTKVAGRGISREGVERLAQIQGFTILWDEENLTIAGNSVDLEIIFDAVDRHGVRDVQLKLNTASSEEPVLQKDASDILKRHLVHSDDSTPNSQVWKSLTDFSTDLEYLSQLDYIDSTVSCFEVMDNLYDTFRKIWDEEKKRMRDRIDTYHLCHGNVGQPVMDRDDHLGITTRFWVERQTYDAITPDVKDLKTGLKKSWRAYFACEKGTTGVRADQKWLTEEPLRTTVTTQDVFQDAQIDKPNWTDVSDTGHKDTNGKDANAMILDDPSHLQESLDLVFTCQLEPAILVPINAANELNNPYHIVDLDQNGAITYQQSLLNACQPPPNTEWDTNTRWAKSTPFVNSHGALVEKQHSYSVFSSGMVWSYPVVKLRFLHPRHYADALPILRQYALLWSIFRNTLGDTKEIQGTSSSHITSTPPSRPPEKPRVTKRSNKQTVQGKLDELLSTRQGRDTSLKVDMTLDVVTDPNKARIDVIVPVSGETTLSKGTRFLHIAIDVCRNGTLNVASLGGIAKEDQEQFKQTAAKILGLSEDISVLVEWLLEKIGVTPSS